MKGYRKINEIEKYKPKRKKKRNKKGKGNIY
jgi:hypothetical protein